MSLFNTPKLHFWPARYWLKSVRYFGFLVPEPRSMVNKIILSIYNTFWIMIVNVYYIIIQFGDLVAIWGDLPQMVTVMTFLFTNVDFLSKILAVTLRKAAVLEIINDGEVDLEEENRPEGRKIINRCCKHYVIYVIIYYTIGVVTTIGWIISPEKGSLPSRAWYPYDEYQPLAFKITYFHQSLALILVALINISFDLMIACLMAITRCRLLLIKLSLSTLGSDLSVENVQSPERDTEVYSRLHSCIIRHQRALRSAEGIQQCFAEPILVQLTVSLVILCVTAYELSEALKSDEKNAGHIVSTLAYFLGMIFQVFLYCNEGDALTRESSEISYGVYSCAWDTCSVRLRRMMLLVMVRAHRPLVVTAGGLATLSLGCFTSMIKASYTFFTVLQQVEV